MKATLLALILGAASQCVAAVGIGIVESAPDGLYIYTSEQIGPATSIRIKVGIDRTADCCRLVHGRDFQKVEPADAVMGEREVERYRLARPDEAPAESRSIGIAIINADTAANFRDEVVAMVGSKRYFVRACLGAEGVNVSALRRGRTVDRLYYSLGYDVSPTCGNSKGH